MVLLKYRCSIKELGRLRAVANDDLDARAFSQTDPSLSYSKRKRTS